MKNKNLILGLGAGLVLLIFLGGCGRIHLHEEIVSYDGDMEESLIQCRTICDELYPLRGEARLSGCRLDAAQCKCRC